MENFLDPYTLEVASKLFIALILGMLIGTERVWAHKTAGMRTYALVSMGAALFIIISEAISLKYFGTTGFDPSRIASQIIVGIGFLGAGAIMHQNSRISGLTSASGLWVTAGIGMSAGFGFYNIALLITIFTLFIFIVLWFVEQRLKKSKFFSNSEVEDSN